MRAQITQTQIKCDFCNQELFNTVYGNVPTYYGNVPTYISIDDMDVCQSCSVVLLENLLKRNPDLKKDLKDLADYRISANRENQILC